MLHKLIFYQPTDYPQKPIVMVEEMIIPLGNYLYCKKIEEKINEYLSHIHLEITIFLLEIEKIEYELYRQENEFAWIINKEINLNKMNNPIILHGIEKNNFLNSYELFEPFYKIQLENIYSFLKTNYCIDDYFRKKYEYENLKNKLVEKNIDKSDIKKI